MSRISYLSFIAVIGGSAAILAGTGQAQINPRNLVLLQASQPGVSQSGHINISGISKANAFVGSGLLLTGLNASELNFGTVPDARINVGGDIAGPLSAVVVSALQGRPVAVNAPTTGQVLTWNGASWWAANPSPVNTAPRLTGTGAAGSPLDLASMGATNGQILKFNGSTWGPAAFLLGLPYVGTTGNNATEVFRIHSTLPFGTQVAVIGETDSLQGTGVKGVSNIGVHGISVDGKGVIGETSGTGTTYGGYFTTLGATGNAIYGRTQGGADAAYVQADGSSANGIRAVHNSLTGNGSGVSGISYSPTGTGGIFSASASGSGSGFGVKGIASQTEGTGVSASHISTTGTGRGLYASSSSATGYGIYAETTHQTGASYSAWIQNPSTAGTCLRLMSNGSSGSTYGAYLNMLSPSGVGIYAHLNSNNVPGAGKVFWGIAESDGQTLIDGDLTASAGSQTGIDLDFSGGNGMGISIFQFLGTAGTNFTGIDVQTSSENGNSIYARSGGEFSHAVHAENSHLNGIAMYASSAAKALKAEATDIVDPDQYAVWGKAYGREGIGVKGTAVSTIAGYVARGVYGEVSGNDSRAVAGLATANAGPTFGGRFTSQSTEGIGAYGYASANTGFTKGLYGEVDSRDGIGVLGNALNTNPAASAYGVYGDSVYTNPGNYAVYGRGTVGGFVKAFVIDHPLDPLNKILRHFCTEGPEALNIYVGTIRTDAKGYATVELPDYYSALNRDGKVQLTVVDDGDSDDFTMAKVVNGGIHGNTFRIRTSTPNAKVDWRVEGIRNDPGIRAITDHVEINKSAAQRGKYLMPEAYGESRERGIRPNLRLKPDPPVSSK